MRKLLVCAGMCAFATAAYVNAQVITFNQPSPWTSCRSGEIQIKALLDTARLDSKPVEVSLYKVSKSGKKKIGSKTLKSSEYSHEITLANLTEKTLGGTEFLKIEWLVKGKNDKGNVQPFGLAVLEEKPVMPFAAGNFISGAVDVAAAVKAADEAGLVSVGAGKVGLAWNEKTLAIIIKKEGLSEEVTISFDAKNGKNSFLSYPDRFVSYNPATDSVRSWHFSRNVSDSGIVYDEKPWVNEISKTSDAQVVCILLPWSDMGLVPFNGRKLGAAVFSGKAAIPASAKMQIPATWGDIVLNGGPAEKKE